MSPLKDLLATIEAEARAERARLDAESRAEAAAIVERAREQARELQDEPVRSQEPELQSKVARRLGQARLGAAQMLRQAREDGYRRLLEETRSQLAALRGTPRYREVLLALLRESRAALPEANLLRVDPRDEALAAGLVRKLDIKVTVEPTLNTTGGIELACEDGRILRNTFEERLANADPELRLRFGRRLAGLGVERREEP